MNPFPYSLDNKRYQTFNYYLKTTYGQKTAKIILDGHFTCPNRDGTKGKGGCLFCSPQGSGDANAFSDAELLRQYSANKEVISHKWPDALYIPYFQAFSNTYGPLEKIRTMLAPFLEMPEVAEIAIATRPDCLNRETVDYLASLTDKKPIWLELGLQSIHDDKIAFLNRGYDLKDYEKALVLLKDSRIKICTHIINSLPGETTTDMLETARYLAKQPIQAIKIHMLQVLKNTGLELYYAAKPFKLLSREEYIQTVVKQLECLPKEFIIQRLTGDPLKEELVEPDWVLNKTTILNDIDKLMVKNNTWQGKYYEQ